MRTFVVVEREVAVQARFKLRYSRAAVSVDDRHQVHEAVLQRGVIDTLVPVY